MYDDIRVLRVLCDLGRLSADGSEGKSRSTFRGRLDGSAVWLVGSREIAIDGFSGATRGVAGPGWRRLLSLPRSGRSLSCAAARAMRAAGVVAVLSLRSKICSPAVDE